MGKKIQVDSFSNMAAAANKLRSLSSTYDQIATLLMRDASTMGAAWDGADNQAFVQQITGFTQELKDMAKKLTICGDALDKQRKNYEDRQDNNITQVKKLVN